MKKTISIMTVVLAMMTTGCQVNNYNETNNIKIITKNESSTKKVNKNQDKSNGETTSNNTSNVNIIDTYTNSELRTINVFLSNFSEQGFDDYSTNNYKESDLIHFAIINRFINAYESSIKYGEIGNYGTRQYISGSVVQNTIEKYFGFTIKNQNIEGFDYVNGQYIFPLADGEMFPIFTQVKEIYKVGTYLNVVGDMYDIISYDDVADNDWRYEPMDSNELSEKGLEKVGSVKAKIQLVNFEGKERYKLLDYKVID